MLPWYQQPRFRVAGAALLAGLIIGGLVTLALGYQGSPAAAFPEQSAADAIASDQAAVATATATPASRPKASARPAKKAKYTNVSVRVSSAATAEPTATPEDEELGNSPASTPVPTRAAPRRQSVVTNPRTQIKPVAKKPTPAKPAPTPPPATPAAPTPAAPTPAPTAAAPQPPATTTPEPPKPPKPPKPHPQPGGDDPGSS